jgi:hypothetical protein
MNQHHSALVHVGFLLCISQNGTQGGLRLDNAAINNHHPTFTSYRRHAGPTSIGDGSTPSGVDSGCLLADCNQNQHPAPPDLATAPSHPISTQPLPPATSTQFPSGSTMNQRHLALVNIVFCRPHPKPTPRALASRRALCPTQFPPPSPFAVSSFHPHPPTTNQRRSGLVLTNLPPSLP